MLAESAIGERKLRVSLAERFSSRELCAKAVRSAANWRNYTRVGDRVNIVQKCNLMVILYHLLVPFFTLKGQFFTT
jgi:hypothetical protein